MFYFAIETGMPGYLPNAREVYACATVDDLQSVIDDYRRWFDGANEARPRNEALTHAGSASSFYCTLARKGTEELRFVGLTQVEYEAEAEAE